MKYPNRYDSKEKYDNDWKIIRQKFGKLTDTFITGWDPSMSGEDIRSKPYSTSFQIPMWFAIRILENCKRRKNIPVRKYKEKINKAELRDRERVKKRDRSLDPF